MRRELPISPNLDHLKAQAKDLLEAFRREDDEALERVTSSLPAARGATRRALAATPFALHDAQSVIAREYGFDSWTALRVHVAATAPPAAEMIRELLGPHLSLPFPPEILQAAMAAAASDGPAANVVLPAALPLLPLRNALLTVGAVAPFSIGRPSSQAALAAARTTGDIIAVFAQRSATDDAPQLADLHPVGCAGRIVRTVSTADRGTWIVVRGLQWIALERLVDVAGGLVAHVSPFVIDAAQTAEVKALDRRLREQVSAFATALPHGKRLLALTTSMSALQLADVTVANVPCSVAEKARYASESTLAGRLAALLGVLGAVS